MTCKLDRSYSKETGPLTVPKPVIDLHCDMLSYLATVAGARPSKARDIGCAIPLLRDGHVKLQVLAIYSGGGRARTALTNRQCEWYKLLTDHFRSVFHPVGSAESVRQSIWTPGVGIVSAIENASALCDEDESLEAALSRFGRLINEVGPIMYISLTHQGENRFGGGNSSEAGLKADGRILLDYLDARGIAVDLSHASDSLAHGILNHIDNKGLDIPVIASHSNFRSVYDHKRNLPDDLALEIVKRKGLIGMNFLRSYLHPDDPSSLNEHISYGFRIGAQAALCFGADFFYTGDHPDHTRVPFFFDEHKDAARYQPILESLKSSIGIPGVEALAYGNAAAFLQRLWSKEARQ